MPQPCTNLWASRRSVPFPSLNRKEDEQVFQTDIDVNAGMQNLSQVSLFQREHAASGAPQ